MYALDDEIETIHLYETTFVLQTFVRLSWGCQFATFKEKRNALTVLGVMVTVSPAGQARPDVTQVETDKEWLSLVEAGELTGIDPKALSYRASKGEFATTKRDESRRCTYVHRDELNRFLANLTLKPRRLRDDIQPRVEINYSPIFTGVQPSLI